jgi:hypothetical protein
MKALNTDDIFMRNLTIALLDLLNGTMSINLARNDEVETFNVPFLYNYGTDEGFLKDFYVGLPDDCQIPVAEGTYDIIPRGIVTLNSFQVKTSDITNKFVRGSFTAPERGQSDQNILTGYSAMLYSLPISAKFDVKIICDNLNKAFKIAERMLEVNYSNRVMYFQYQGVRIPAQFQFPSTENFADGKKYTFNYSDNNKINVTMSIDVETYFPSFEQSSKRKASNFMGNVNLNIGRRGTQDLSGEAESTNPLRSENSDGLFTEDGFPIIS